VLENVTIEETWKAMEELVRKGKVRSIGVSNYNVTRLEQILKIAEIPPAVLQVETHPHFVDQKLVSFAQQNGIHVFIYLPPYLSCFHLLTN